MSLNLVKKESLVADMQDSGSRL